MKAHFMRQRSPEWYQARIGLLTGSQAYDLITIPKRASGELKGKTDLRKRLVCERLTGLPSEEPFITYAMQWGLDMEKQAFFAYEMATGLVAHRVGFVTHDTLKAGCSPDGYIGNWEGIVELKCPKSPTHLENLQAGVIPERYLPQCLHALWITGAQWCDFCSFDPRFPEGLDLMRVRLHRNEDDLQSYELAVTLFLSEVDRQVDEVRSRVRSEVTS